MVLTELRSNVINPKFRHATSYEFSVYNTYFLGGIGPSVESRFNTDLLKIKNRDNVVLCTTEVQQNAADFFYLLHVGRPVPTKKM